MGTLVGYTPSALVVDFRSLKQEIDDEGLFKVGALHAWPIKYTAGTECVFIKTGSYVQLDTTQVSLI